jgi:PAS domain S-box-containing protein
MITMSQSLFFNSTHQLPIATINNFVDELEYSHMEKVPAKNPQTSSLEAELNTRLELMDQTALVTITDLQGNIMYANDLFCKVSGFGRHELIGKTHQVIRDPELPIGTVESVMKRLLTGETWSGMVKNISKAGQAFWTRTTIAPVLDHNDKPFKLIWMRNDITDLKRTELELLNAKERSDQRLLENVKNAFRIQSAILPSESDLQEIFPMAFLLNAPQQSVSGDFYWFDKQKTDTVFVLGDGTGHGVSASFVSLIAITALEFIVKQNQETDPGKILTGLNKFLFQSMKKHRGSELDESIDMAVCSYNHKTRMLRYSAAKSKIYLVRGMEVYNLDRDDVSVGEQSDETFKINSKSIFLEKGDRIFMMSDGFSDQVGGDKNKRMGSKQLRELLKNTGSQHVIAQKEAIMNFFLNWKGDNEQTDDLSLLGFSIT